MPLKWSDLTLDEQIAAQENEFHEFLMSLMELGKDFLPEELWPNFTDAVEHMKRMRTPWFLGERIMEDPKLVAYITKQANEWARNAIYLVDGEHATHIPKVKKK